VLRARLLALDAISLVIAYVAIRMLRLDASGLADLQGWLELAGFAFANLVSLYLFDLYSISPQASAWTRPLQTWISAGVAGSVIVVAYYVLGAIEFREDIGRGVVMGSQLMFAVLASTSRAYVARTSAGRAARSRWLVVGTEPSLSEFIDDVTRSGTTGSYTLVGPKESLRVPWSHRVRVAHHGSCAALAELALESWSGVIVASGAPLSDEAIELLLAMRSRGVDVMGLPDYYEHTWFKVPVSLVERRWFAVSRGFELLASPARLRIKRLFDIVGALTLLILSLPLTVLAALLIKLESPGPVLYQQTRVGENDTLFTIYKLRSMRNDAEKNGAQWSTANDARVTRVGAFIRRTRIDELPQLFNVLGGSMSFVGPRPERPEFTTLLRQEIPLYALRHAVKPGLTGWAQVMYPYGASIDDARQKLQYDLYYVKNHSMLLDIAIVLRTIRVVLSGVPAQARASADDRITLVPPVSTTTEALSTQP
jgi:sugar transferase (PEP-CTERM system associated)